MCRFIIVAPDSMDALHWGQVDDDKPFSTDWEHVQACYQYVTTLPHVIKNRSRIVYAGAPTCVSLESMTDAANHPPALHSDARSMCHTMYTCAGFSRGGYSAGAIASRFAEATHGLVMHSAVTPQQVRMLCRQTAETADNKHIYTSTHAHFAVELYMASPSERLRLFCVVQIGTHVVPIRFSTGNKDTLFTIRASSHHILLMLHILRGVLHHHASHLQQPRNSPLLI